jgi:hypothetical protein
MSAKITIDILESYPQCKYKCYLQLLGEQGPPSAYEPLMRDTRHCLRLAARDALLSQYGASENVCHHAATTTLLAQGAPLLWDATLERIFPPHFAARRTISEGYLPSCSLM